MTEHKAQEEENAKRPPPVIRDAASGRMSPHMVRGIRGFWQRRRLDRAKELIKTGTDRPAAALYRNLKRQAEGFLQSPLPTPPASYQTDFNVRRRMHSLALMYRLQGDKRYLDRIWQELDIAAKFPQWNPDHFLDTAEMSNAFAVAYNWLYDAWSEDQRKLLRESIVEKGLKPGMDCYQGKGMCNW